MNITYYLLIGIGVVIIVILLTRKGRETAVGIYNSALEQITKKKENKEKALEFIRNKGEVGNDDIREYLGVSRRSVARYLDELEMEGKVEQIGDIGRGVTYRSK